MPGSDGIAILTAARSGSSMVASIFAAHGVWTGPCKPADRKNPRGYYESEPFKRALRAFHGEPHQWPAKAQEVLRRAGYTAGPWLVKYSVFYWPLWREMGCSLVTVRRDPESVLASGEATKYLIGRDLLEKHLAALDAAESYGAVPVMTDQVVAGDFSSLERAFAHCGLDFDSDIARSKVDPSLWHFHA